MSTKTEFRKYPIAHLHYAPSSYFKESIIMTDQEFLLLIKPHCRIIHEASIGWIYEESNLVGIKKVIIYGLPGSQLKEEKQELIIYSFFVRYENRIWRCYDIIVAIQLAEAIRLYEIKSQKKKVEGDKRGQYRMRIVKEKETT